MEAYLSTTQQLWMEQYASDYIIRRSQFSDNAAGDDGGVMLIGRLNCFVSIDESIFDFNSAADRGGVIALIGSSNVYGDQQDKYLQQHSSIWRSYQCL